MAHAISALAAALLLATAAQAQTRSNTGGPPPDVMFCNAGAVFVFFGVLLLLNMRLGSLAWRRVYEDFRENGVESSGSFVSKRIVTEGEGDSKETTFHVIVDFPATVEETGARVRVIKDFVVEESFYEGTAEGAAISVTADPKDPRRAVLTRAIAEGGFIFRADADGRTRLGVGLVMIAVGALVSAMILMIGVGDKENAAVTLGIVLACTVILAYIVANSNAKRNVRNAFEGGELRFGGA